VNCILRWPERLRPTALSRDLIPYPTGGYRRLICSCYLWPLYDTHPSISKTSLRATSGTQDTLFAFMSRFGLGSDIYNLTIPRVPLPGSALRAYELDVVASRDTIIAIPMLFRDSARACARALEYLTSVNAVQERLKGRNTGGGNNDVAFDTGPKREIGGVVLMGTRQQLP
jgi:hypothetical protein